MLDDSVSALTNTVPIVGIKSAGIKFEAECGILFNFISLVT